jgi:ribosomal protein L24
MGGGVWRRNKKQNYIYIEGIMIDITKKKKRRKQL